MTVSLHTIAPKFGSRKRRKRLGIGDGSGHGKTSTRGQKGQTSRSGDGKMVGFEGGQNPLLRRIPKRGFRNTAFRTSYQVVSLASLARVFKNSSEVSLEALRVHGLVKGSEPVKVLGDGELDKALKVQAHAFSKSAQEKIKKAGGTAEIVGAAL
ncbi:MAG: 50S ribosomal protein L15 [Elusimicrobia bacterium]|nr:50S ribosomal protein L15 [Elusimicrobiota bacterium]